LSKIDIYKNGQKVKTKGNVHVDVSGEVLTLLFDKVSMDDEAIYYVRVQDSKKDHGEVKLTVTTDVSAEEEER
jgi:hypothetical protein